jgi:N-acetylmuramoyl-L-alanine amidase
MIKSKTLLIILLFSFLILNFSGCATIPEGPSIPSYTLGGVTYLSLIPLCQAKGMQWEYDAITRTAILTRGAHKVNLMVGDKMILVDGEPRHLNQPVDIYEGAVVVPVKLEEILNSLLVKETYSYTRPSLALSRIKKVVIDAGHGGNDPGAIGRSGMREKAVNLDIAKRLAKILRDEGIQVVMTRSNDSFISLERRVDIANNVAADLFISIHSNANRVRSLNGFEIYYLASRSDDYKWLLATAESANLNLDSGSFSGRSRNLKAILWDMVYTYNRAESLRLSRSICRSIDTNLETRVIGIKKAGFYVLKGVRMPAVLIELGFLSNSDEERLLRNSYYRQQIADAIAGGIANYARDYAFTEAGN